MIALLGFIIVAAIILALAPIILGVIGSMLALILTAFLYVLAGCPKHEAPKHTEAQKAQQEAPMRQIDAWLEEDSQDRPHAKPTPASEERVLEGQRRGRFRRAR